MSESVAATKKKRGRPRKYEAYEHDGWYSAERSKRSVQNYANAEVIVDVVLRCYEEDGMGKQYPLSPFFYYDDGPINAHAYRYRHQGIAEQIGRMYNAGLIDDKAVVKLVTESKTLVWLDGMTSREVEKKLRQYHKMLKSGAATEKTLLKDI